VFLGSAVGGYFLSSYLKAQLSIQKRLNEELELRMKELLARGITVKRSKLPTTIWVETSEFKLFLKGLTRYKYKTVFLDFREVDGIYYPVFWVALTPDFIACYTCLGNLTKTAL